MSTRYSRCSTRCGASPTRPRRPPGGPGGSPNAAVTHPPRAGHRRILGRRPHRRRSKVGPRFRRRRGSTTLSSGDRAADDAANGPVAPAPGGAAGRAAARGSTPRGDPRGPVDWLSQGEPGTGSAGGPAGLAHSSADAEHAADRPDEQRQVDDHREVPPRTPAHEPDREHIPVLCLQMPPNPSPQRFYSAILAALGAPTYTRDRTQTDQREQIT